MKINFLNQTLFSIAIGHSSPAKKRLELLGDAILNTAVIDYLQQTIPDRSTGEYTHLKEAYIKNNRLSQVAEELSIDKFSEERGRNLANTIEALIGAVYRDQGYNTAKNFIFSCLLPPEKEIKKLQKANQIPTLETLKKKKIKKARNPLTSPRFPPQELLLREKVDKIYGTTPYIIAEQEENQITIYVCAKGDTLAIENGENEKETRINAINSALVALKKIEDCEEK